MQPYTKAAKQSFNNFETITPHPNSTCAPQMFHTTESGLCWNVASVERSYVDEVMRCLQGSNEKAEIKRFGSLSVRVGVAGLEEKAGMTVAKVIEFYIPNNFRKRVKWVSPERRGKIIEFPSQMKKSA
jgi:hypothetical protein